MQDEDRYGHIVSYDTREHLAAAARQAEKRGLKDWLIVDCDAHIYENESWAEIVSMIENPIIRDRALAGVKKGGLRAGLTPVQVGDQDMGGRVIRYVKRQEERVEGHVHRQVELVRRYMDSMGVDYCVLFPTPMLNLGLHPEAAVEVAIARAYARWMTEVILPQERRIRAMLYLPFNSPEESVRLVEEFGEKPGVAGFMVTSVRYRPVHDNVYMRLYRALEERGKPLGFHTAYNWMGDRTFELMNRFISVHALGFPWFNMVHCTNWVVNALPERFPNLKVIWIEGGLAWVVFLMERLDNEYVKRSSECPGLERKPSEYMRDFYYTTQPLELAGNRKFLELACEMINAETQLLFASDYPHWDFDVPSVVYDLPFLSERAKRRILGENARELFGIESA